MKYTDTSKKSTKKSLIGKISKGLLELQFKTNHSIKSKCLIRYVKYMFLTIQKHANLFFKVIKDNNDSHKYSDYR